MVCYEIRIGRRCFKRLKGHYFHYEKGIAELTEEDNTVHIVPIRGKYICVENKWFFNRSEKIKEQTGGQVDVGAK